MGGVFVTNIGLIEGHPTFDSIDNIFAGRNVYLELTLLIRGCLVATSPPNCLNTDSRDRCGKRLLTRDALNRATTMRGLYRCNFGQSHLGAAERA